MFSHLVDYHTKEARYCKERSRCARKWEKAQQWANFADYHHFLRRYYMTQMQSGTHLQ